MRKVVLVSGARTPYVKAGNAFKDLSAVDLGSRVIAEVIKRAALISTDVDEVVMGNVTQPLEAANIARVIALRAGLPNSVSAYTVQRNCGSGLQAIAEAFDKITLGLADIVIAGGVESMSNISFFYSKELKEIISEIMAAKTISRKLKALIRLRPKFLRPLIGLQLGLTDFLINMNMGQTAEVLAARYNISRHEQDQFALASNHKAEKAIKSGRFNYEIVPTADVREDIGPRFGQTMEALAKLPPVFKKLDGTVTAGNSSQITDGAAVVLCMSEEVARAHGFSTDIVIRGYAFAGCEPKTMGLGPVYATKKLLTKMCFQLSDFRLIEINEAFAAQVLACLQVFKNEGIDRVDGEILNVNGGAIALGHPVGSSGTRLILTLMQEMRLKNINGPVLATLCIGGGQGGAMVIERN